MTVYCTNDFSNRLTRLIGSPVSRLDDLENRPYLEPVRLDRDAPGAMLPSKDEALAFVGNGQFLKGGDVSLHVRGARANKPCPSREKTP